MREKVNVQRVNKQEFEDCLRELMVHRLVKDGTDKETCVITDKALDLILEARRQMREKYPKVAKEDVKSRALIFLVFQQMGKVVRKYVPVYVGILDALTEHING